MRELYRSNSIVHYRSLTLGSFTNVSVIAIAQRQIENLFSYLVLVIVRHQRKPAFFKIIEHKKMSFLERGLFAV